VKNYCTGLLLPGERKSVEPMAARLAPDNVRRMHQSLHHLVADAPWNDEEMLAQVRGEVLPTMQKHGPVVAWIVDDTGFPKQGKHSVGVARQYCGQVGKQDNCQVAVSLSVSTWNASLPIAWRLYLPEAWCQDAKRCREAGVPEGVEFQTKPEIAFAADSASFAAAGSCGSGAGRCRLWAQHWIPLKPNPTGIALYRRYRDYHLRVGTGETAPVGPAATTRPWSNAHAPAAQHGSSAAFGKAVGPGFVVFGLEGHRLASRQSGNLCDPVLPLCVCVLPIAMRNAPNPARKNGF